MNNDILARYEQAQTILQGWQTNLLVKNDAVFPHWIDNSQCFWYTRQTENGKEFRLVDANAATNIRAFDQQALANALTEITGESIDPENLPLTDVSMTLSPLRVCFQFQGKYWRYDPDSAHCQEQEVDSEQCVHSPDGKKTAFVRDHNLWIRDKASGEECALTQDGTKDYSYGRAFYGFDLSVQVLWSPDSEHLLAVQYDLRKVATRNIVSVVPLDGSLPTKIFGLKMAYPGDKHVESYRLLSINVKSGHIQPVYSPNLPYVPVSALMYGFFTAGLGWWSPDNQHAFYVDVARGAKEVRVVRLDTQTGVTQVLFKESRETYIKLNGDDFSPVMFVPLPETNELIWYSERSGWAHLYLYDLNTGELKHSITEGEWLVRSILQVDTERRELLLQTAARDPDINPYYRDICKVNIDSGILSPLKTGRVDNITYNPAHQCVIIRRELSVDYSDKVHAASPCGQYVVTTNSRVDTAPVSVLIDRDGRDILTLEATDTSGLPDNWHWPVPVKLKAADGQTDIYGTVFYPPGFSQDKRYPVIDFLCSGRSISTLPDGSFINQYITTYYEMAALAALGFIVVGIAGRGTPHRDKAFQDHNFGVPGYDDDLNDHIAGIRQLAEIRPYMDLNKVGAVCMEGSINVIYAQLNHSNFYKVTVCHALGDSRFFPSTYERFDGIVDEETLSKTHYPEDCIESFGGKLLLIHGLMPGSSEASLRVVEALQKANRDFDMLCLPNMASQVTSYGRRRGWDYFVTHLQGIKPPHEFHLISGEDLVYEAANINISAMGVIEEMSA